MVPALILLYVVAFLVSMRGMPTLAVAFPRMIIAVILGMFVLQAARYVVRRSRPRDGHPAPAPGEEAAGAGEAGPDRPDGRPSDPGTERGSAVGDRLRAWAAPAGLVVLAAGYVLAVPVLGFPLGTALLLGLALLVLGVRAPRLWAVYVVGWTALAYLGFVVLLDVPLPTGVVAEVFGR